LETVLSRDVEHCVVARDKLSFAAASEKEGILFKSGTNLIASLQYL
jgi:hypothetical protein